MGQKQVIADLKPELPIDGHVTIGPRMSALMTYFTVAHSFPYDQLSQVTKDLLGFAISEGTIANKLSKMRTKIQGIDILPHFSSG